MNTHTPPGLRQLALVWLLLMALGTATMLAGKVTTITSLGSLWMVVLMAVTWLKANLVLRYFLELNAASGGWNKVFITLVSLIIIILLSLYVSSTLIPL